MTQKDYEAFAALNRNILDRAWTVDTRDVFIIMLRAQLVIFERFKNFDRARFLERSNLTEEFLR